MLFTSWTIGNCALRNRTVRSAVWEGLATEDGHVTTPLVQAMEALAAGEVGLIISSHAYVSKAGQAGPRQLGIHSDDCIAGLTEMTAAVHAYGGTIFAQLAHAGGFAFPALSGEPAKGPAVVQREGMDPCEVMTEEDIHGVVQDFADAAVRAQRAGFDGVQIHAAHGYCLSQFLSPVINDRTDGYGGSAEGRRRILEETVLTVRAAVGPEYPVIIKLNSDDFMEGGITPEMQLETVQALQDKGLDAVELSGGRVVNPPKTHCARVGKAKTAADEAWYREAAQLIVSQSDLPLILVGGIRSHDVAEELLQSGIASAISLARPLIREPALVKRWKGGDMSAAACISCNKCYGPLLENKGYYCPLDKEQTEEV